MCTGGTGAHCAQLTLTGEVAPSLKYGARMAPCTVIRTVPRRAPFGTTMCRRPPRGLPARVAVAVIGKEETAAGMRCQVVLKDRSSVWAPT